MRARAGGGGARGAGPRSLARGGCELLTASSECELYSFQQTAHDVSTGSTNITY